MQLPPPLPKRRNGQLVTEPYSSTFEISANWNNLLNVEANINYIKVINIMVDSLKKEEISNHIEKMQYLKRFPNLERIFISSFDFYTLCYMSTILKELALSKEAILLDDFKNIDRSYINPSKLEGGMKLTDIPYSYVMWNVPFHRFSTLKHLGSTAKKSSNGYIEVITEPCDYLDDFPSSKTINEITEQAKKYSQIPELTTVDKVILVSNFIQNKMQFAEGKYSTGSDGTYIIENFPENINTANINDVLKFHLGKCAGFSRIMMLMLNNPIMNVNCRIQRGIGHDYCIIIDEDENTYVVDPTWDITKNQNRYESALKAKSFGYDYLLIGQDRLSKMQHHENFGIMPNQINNTSLDRSIIEESISKLKSFGYSFVYPDYIPYSSTKDPIIGNNRL